MMRTGMLRGFLFATVAACPSTTPPPVVDFGSAFPVFPCSDGWSGCFSDGLKVTPEPQPDASGLPSPSSSRAGFWDLEPTAAFSPFASLSHYDGPRAHGLVHRCSRLVSAPGEEYSRGDGRLAHGLDRIVCADVVDALGIVQFSTREGGLVRVAR